MEWKTADRPIITNTTLPSRLTDQPWKELATNLGLIVLGTVLLVAAAEGQKLWYVLLWFSLGMVALAIAFLYVNDWLASQLTDEPSAPPDWWWIFGGMTVLGAGGLFVCVRWHWPQFVAAVAVLVLTTGLIGVHVGAGHGDRPPPPSTDPWYRAIGRASQTGAVVMGVSPIVIAVLGSFRWPSWLLLFAWLLGLITLKMGITPFLVSRRTKMWPTMIAMIAVSLAGAVLVAVGLSGSLVLLALPGVSIVIGALSVLGLALVHWDMSKAWSFGLMLMGAATTLAGVVWATDVLNIDGLGRVVALFVFGVGTWYVFRGEGIVVALMVGWLAVWGLTDRTAHVPVDPHAGSEVRMLAIGDSFISGEGADEFLPGTNEAGGNECRRAATAYSYLVAKGSQYSLDFLACQGAKIDELTRCGQMTDRAPFADELLDPDRENCTAVPDTWATLDRSNADAEVAGFVPQLHFFEPEVYEQYHVVLVSIGGNDAGFSTLVKSCLLPQDCSDRSEVWTALARAQHSRLVELYTRLRDMTGPHTVIAAMPYPPIATGEDCQLGLSETEHAFIDAHIEELHRVIASAAEQAGITFYGETTAAYLGHDLCRGDDAGANHLLIETTEGSPSARYQPGKWIHGSMHPNEIGHLALARELMDDVQSWAEEVQARREAGIVDDRPPPVDDPVGPDYDEALAAEGRALVADGDWMTEELYDSLTSMLGPLVMLLVSGIGFAAGFLRTDNWLSRALRSRETLAGD